MIVNINLYFQEFSSEIVIKINKCSEFCLHFTVQKLIIKCWMNQSTESVDHFERAEKNLNVVNLQKDEIRQVQGGMDIDTLEKNIFKSNFTICC